MSDRDFGIGIDLGTSMSAISRVDISSGRYEFVEARDLTGHSEVPSVAYFDLDGTVQFGETAAHHQKSAHDAGRVVTNVKLMLRENAPIELPGLATPVQPERIVRGLLAHLKKCFEMEMKMPCTRAVVTVPAHRDFDFDYRAAVRRAASIGDPLFESLSIIPEPDAVLMSIGDLSTFTGERILVFDMGGGTLDVSIREVDDQDGRPILRQLAVGGSDAAGRRVTEGLADLIISIREREQGFSYSDDLRRAALQMNFLAIDETKRILSSLAHQHGLESTSTTSCQLLSPDTRGMYTVKVTPKDMSAVAERVCTEARDAVEKVLTEAGLDVTDIDRYFVVGGSSQLPQITTMLTELFDGQSPNPLQGAFGNVSSTLAVVRGASIEDLNRLEDSSVPSTQPVTLPALEQRLPYAISMEVNERAETDVLVPSESLLPFGPVERTYYVQRTGDLQIDFILLRGEGRPEDCVKFAPRTIELFEPGVAGDELHVSWFLDDNGEMVVTAHDNKKRELGVIRANYIDEES